MTENRFIQAAWISISFSVLFFAVFVKAEDTVPYGVANWPHEMGNHRAVVEVKEKADAVYVHIPWRRKDLDVTDKGVIVVDLKTGNWIKNIALININREFGDIVFQPKTVPGEYAVYYYPLERIVGRQTGCADYKYLKLQPIASKIWIQKYGLTPNRYLEGNAFASLPRGKVLRIEARREFDRFDPMEVIATAVEVKTILNYNRQDDFLLFPEDREHPIKMADDIPLRWIENGGPSDTFEATADRNEFFAFQIGVFAARSELKDLEVNLSDLTGEGGVISESQIDSINTGGIDALGQPFSKSITVEKGKVQALWFVVRVPKDLPAGKYSGEITIGPKDGKKKSVEVTLDVTDKVSADGGVGNPASFARLAWLNSPIGLEDTITPPYTPMSVEGRQINCMGKTVTLGQNGLPKSIKAGGNEVLATPIRFEIFAGGTQQYLKSDSLEIDGSRKSRVTWQAASGNSNVSLTLKARMEYDGYAFYSFTLKALRDIDITDTVLEIPYRKKIAVYMMGLDTGYGGYRKNDVKWKWQESPNNKIWIGDVEAGLRCKLRGPKEIEHVWSEYRCEVNGIPQSWSNNGAGGCDVIETKPDKVLVKAYTGPRKLQAGQEIEFNFSLLITPVKPRDPEHWISPKNWDYRMSMMAQGGQVVKGLGAISGVAFQGTPLNPWINYPFLTPDTMKGWIKDLQKYGLKARIYYKVGELSNHVVELWPLMSLGDEVIEPGASGGGEWLQEHMTVPYVPCWYCTPYGLEEPADAAIGTTGMSRWNNYYASGIDWLLKNYDIYGIYYDGIRGYSRQMIQRVRRVFDSAKPGCILDYHSGNNITRRSNAYNDTMEHLPYFDCTWIGEGFSYEAGPDFYMVELSGIPFGVPNAMLQFGGNPWRGMIYGMAGRYIENHSSASTSLWKFWDQVNIRDARMIGYWDKNCPVKSQDPTVLATVYQFKDKALIALASWNSNDVDTKLSINWKKLGLNPKDVIAYAPDIAGFQPAKVFDIIRPITVPGGRGWLILLEPKDKQTLSSADRFDSGKMISKADVGFKDPAWSIQKVGDSKGEVDVDAGQKLTLKAPENSAVYMQRNLPVDVNGVQVAMKMKDLQPPRGTWHEAYNGLEAPGVAIDFGPGKKLLRVYAASYGTVAIDDGIMDQFFHRIWVWKKTEKDATLYLRAWWDKNDIYLQGSIDGKTWETFHSYPLSIFGNKPLMVKLGKMGKPYGWPRTMGLTNNGPLQEVEYEDVQFWREPK